MNHSGVVQLNIANATVEVNTIMMFGVLKWKLVKYTVEDDQAPHPGGYHGTEEQIGRVHY